MGHVSLVLEDRVVEDGRLVVRRGRIVEVGAHPAGSSRAGRCCEAHGHGLHLLPGLIDVHSDSLGRECHPRPGASLPAEFALGSTTARLRGAGLTTAFHGVAYQEHSATGMPIDSPRAMDLAPVVDAAGLDGGVDHRVLHRLDVRCRVGRAQLADRVAAQHAAGRVPLVSHEDHTPGQGQYADPAVMQRWLQRGEGMSEQRSADHLAWWRAHRDERLELGTETLDWLGGLARAGRIRLFGHDPATAEEVDELVERGGSVAEFPTTREAAARARERGLHVVAGAPNVVRGGSHAGNVSASQLAAAGLVDVLASDYLPTALLPAAVTLASSGALSLPRAVALVTAGPAASVGFSDRGRLQPGLRADLVLADLGTAFPTVHWSTVSKAGT